MSNNTELPSRMASESKPVRGLLAVAAASTVLAAGLPILTPSHLDWIGPAVGLVGLVITAGVAKFTEDKVTPWQDVAAKVTPTGRVVAGPAAEQPTGSSVVVTTDVVGTTTPGGVS